MTAQSLIMVDPEVLGGTPVFKGTRVPITTLFDYFKKAVDSMGPIEFRRLEIPKSF